MAADKTTLWLNGLHIVRPTEKFAAEVGREILEMLTLSMRPDRERDPFEPIGHVIIDITAS